MEDGVSNWSETETTLSSIESTQENTGIYSWAYCHWHFLYIEYLRPLITANYGKN